MNGDKNINAPDIQIIDNVQLYFEQVNLLYRNAPIALMGIVVSIIVITSWLVYFVPVDIDFAGNSSPLYSSFKI
jgi:hypothetical protein